MLLNFGFTDVGDFVDEVLYRVDIKIFAIFEPVTKLSIVMIRMNKNLTSARLTILRTTFRIRGFVQILPLNVMESYSLYS